MTRKLQKCQQPLLLAIGILVYQIWVSVQPLKFVESYEKIFSPSPCCQWMVTCWCLSKFHSSYFKVSPVRCTLLAWWNLQVQFLWPEGRRERFGRCSMISMGVLQMSIGHVRSVFKKIMVFACFCDGASKYCSLSFHMFPTGRLDFEWSSQSVFSHMLRWHGCLKDHTVTWRHGCLKPRRHQSKVPWVAKASAGILGLLGSGQSSNAKAWAIDPVRFGARWLQIDWWQLWCC